MKPAGRARGRNDMDIEGGRTGVELVLRGAYRQYQQMANVSPQIRAALRRGANLRPERRPP
jgi:hypothetical protein